MPMMFIHHARIVPTLAAFKEGMGGMAHVCMY